MGGGWERIIIGLRMNACRGYVVFKRTGILLA